MPTEAERWIENCVEHLGIPFKEIAHDFIKDELDVNLADNLTRFDIADELKAQIISDSQIFNRFKEFFRLKIKEKQETIRRAYYRINEPTRTLNNFDNDTFRRLIVSRPPNDNEDESGFHIVASNVHHISRAEYTHYNLSESYFDVETAEWKRNRAPPFKLNFYYDHRNNLLIVESNGYSQILALVSDFEDLSTYDVEPFGVYYQHSDNPTETMLQICQQLFDDSWMENDEAIMQRLEEENPPSKYISELYNKNNQRIRRIGNIDLSKCELSYSDLNSNRIISSLRLQNVVLIGFRMFTYYKNMAFIIRLKTSVKFASLVIERASKESGYNEMQELKEKVENMLYNKFR